MTLYAHQKQGVAFLAARSAAGLFWEMGVGKTRAALFAAKQLFDEKKIDRMIVLVPAAVAIAWKEELTKLGGNTFIPCVYDSKLEAIYGARIALAEKQEPWQVATAADLPILIVSYSLLPQLKHVKAFQRWCS